MDRPTPPDDAASDRPAPRGLGRMKSLNFELLRDNYAQLAVPATFAEKYAHPDPGSALVKLRSFAEGFVQFIYIKLALPEPVGASFYDLLRESTFESAVPRVVQLKLDGIRRYGNKAAHGDSVTTDDALRNLREAHELGCWLVMRFNAVKLEELPSFQLPTAGGAGVSKGQLKREKKELLERLSERKAELNAAMAELAELRAQADRTAHTPEQVQESLEAGVQAANELEFNEAETRRRLIDDQLEAAGWLVPRSGRNEHVAVEFEVEHQPTPSGKGAADYVLWGDDGKPLGVVEAKRASSSAEQGRAQARIYADGLEKMYGTRPVIFYTNGFDIHIWDDAQKRSPRRIWGFYSKDSLHQLHFQRTRSQEASKLPPKMEIINRLYQLEAVKRVTERFDNGHRHALVVLATGTGKTRLSIALTDVLLRSNRVKRVLFLCDRRELRKQAMGAFKSHLPDASRIVVKSDTAHERNKQVYFATYPAMMKCFESFDVGFFDLIIADESHRSIYNKYGDLFRYFDALQIGLTATPVGFIERDTYKLFKCDDKDATAYYSLTDAVAENYLVPPRVTTFTTAFQREGIKYDKLSDTQRRELEEQVANAEEIDHDAKDLDRVVFNKDTNRQIVRNLMENGVRDESGQRPGKTVIFARSHDHANLLAGLFAEMYPSYDGDFCQVIDYKTTRAEQLIDDFKGLGRREITIAISVDMLDTGVDVPEIVNLVFAKPVKSVVKFWQMIGRGTRLCPNLFGPGEHKKYFAVFDHWGNFAYFDEQYVERDPARSKSLMQQLFEARVSLAHEALRKAQMAEFAVLNDQIHQMLQQLEASRAIAVRERSKELKSVLDRRVLSAFAPETRSVLDHDMAGLMRWIDVQRENQAAYRFDRFMLELQAEVLTPAGKMDDLKGRLITELDQLKMHLNQVRAKAETLAQVRSDAFWEGVTFTGLEEVRLELRSIIKFRESAATPRSVARVIDVQDRAADETNEYPVRMEGLDEVAYRKRVEEVLLELFDESPVLKKIKAREPISDEELRELLGLAIAHDSRVDLRRLTVSGDEAAPSLEVAIRRVIGLEAAAVEQQFASFVQAHPHLDARQIQFLRLLKKQLSQRGTVGLDDLYDAPFTSFHPDGLDGVFTDESQVGSLLDIVQRFEAPASPGDST